MGVGAGHGGRRHSAARPASVSAAAAAPEMTLAGHMGSLGGIARTGVDLTARDEVVV